MGEDGANPTGARTPEGDETPLLPRMRPSRDWEPLAGLGWQSTLRPSDLVLDWVHTRGRPRAAHSGPSTGGLCAPSCH